MSQRSRKHITPTTLQKKEQQMNDAVGGSEYR